MLRLYIWSTGKTFWRNIVVFIDVTVVQTIDYKLCNKYSCYLLSEGNAFMTAIFWIGQCFKITCSFLTSLVWFNWLLCFLMLSDTLIKIGACYRQTAVLGQHLDMLPQLLSWGSIVLVLNLLSKVMYNYLFQASLCGYV